MTDKYKKDSDNNMVITTQVTETIIIDELIAQNRAIDAEELAIEQRYKEQLKHLEDRRTRIADLIAKAQSVGIYVDLTKEI